MKRFCKDFREHAMKLVDYGKKEMIPLKNKSFEKQKVCYMCKKGFSTDNDNGIAFNKMYHKGRYQCHYTGKFREAAHSICNLRRKTPKEIPTVFHNGSVLHSAFFSTN